VLAPAPVDPPAIEPLEDAFARMKLPPRLLALDDAPAPVLDEAPPDELPLADCRHPVSVIDCPL